MKETIIYLVEQPLVAVITLIIGFATGVAITALYAIDLYRQNQEMLNSLGRPTRKFFKK
jgi:hypothetical protein